MTTFHLEEREQADARLRLVEVTGELDLTNARDFESALDDLPDDDAMLVLDLSRVVFVDSAALHVLFRQARARGAERFGIALEPTAAIARTVEIAGLGNVTPVRPTPEEALAATAGMSR